MRGALLVLLMLTGCTAARATPGIRSSPDDGPRDKPISSQPKMLELTQQPCVGEDLLIDEYEVDWLCGRQLLRTSLIDGSTTKWVDAEFGGQLVRDATRILAIRNQSELVALIPHSNAAPTLLLKAPHPILALASDGDAVVFTYVDSSLMSSARMANRCLLVFSRLPSRGRLRRRMGLSSPEA